MNLWEVTYSVYSNNINESGAWTMESGMPSQFTTTVVAFNQTQAEQQVRNMNGGSNHCLVRSCRLIG
jgi:hypothetical protein